MKLNLENGVKLEIKRSEIKELTKSYTYLMSQDEELKNLGVELILGILPKDKSVGVILDSKDTVNPVIGFIKMASDPNNYVEISPENWIIDEEN